MPDSDLAAHVLDVPGARLYYERRGTGPLLPDSAQVRAQFEDIYDTYRADGAEKAMQQFFAQAGLTGAMRPRSETPSR